VNKLARNIHLPLRRSLMASVLTFPVAMMLSGFLFWTFRKIF